MDFRSEVQKALELARDNKVIGKSLEAAVTVYPSEPVRDMLDDVDANVMQLFDHKSLRNCACNYEGTGRCRTV